jgi:sugar transferase EpsL
MVLKLKRCVDIVAASLLGVIAIVPSLLIALGIRLSMGSPVFFRQNRPGFQSEIFTLLKFRTMDETALEDELSHDARITRFGRILRASSLDELPQLINILKGEMSFIGPRPTTIENDRYFTEHERLRYEMHPGLTGWAQVNGRNRLSWDDRLALDVWYVQNWSLWLDARIALKTVKVILSRRGFVNDETSVISRISDERGDPPQSR